MEKAVNSILTVLVSITVFFFVFTGLAEADIRSPVNGKILARSSAEEGYTFFAAGHLYGAPENRHSVFPSPSLIAAVDNINRIDYGFFVSLGDNIRTTDKVHIANFGSSFAQKLKAPLFIAVGNHDVHMPEMYEEYFGRTYYNFVYGRELFVILDTEKDEGDIRGEQLEYLLEILNEARTDAAIRRIFVFSHKLIWSVDDPGLRIVYDHLNARDGYVENGNYSKIIYPLLSDIAEEKPVYWFSGDIGCSWSLPLFYGNDPSGNITYAAAGLGDTAGDALLKINVSVDTVSITPVPLSGGDMQPIEHYGTAYWEEHFRADLLGAARTKPLKLLRDRFYWAGILTGIVAALTCFYIIRQKKKSKNA